jgi:hypothetical protein
LYLILLAKHIIDQSKKKKIKNIAEKQIFR